MDSKRDLHADLAVCEAATAGPWAVDKGLSVYHGESGGTICDVGDPYPRGKNRPSENMRFIAEARTGWPHAIERALAAEAENAELRRQLSELCPVAEFDVATSLRVERAQAAEYIAELEAEVKRLRTALEEIASNDGLYYLSSQHALSACLRVAKDALNGGDRQ